MHQINFEDRPSDIAVMGIRGIPASYGGFETCAEQITRIWSEHGYAVVVYCRHSHYEHKPTHFGEVRLRYVSSIAIKSLDTLTHTFFCVLNLLIFERKVKVVHLYNTGNGIFVPLLKLFGKRVVVSGDGLEWKREKWGGLARLVHKLGERMAAAFADKVVVDNEEVRKYYSAAFDAEPALIPYGAKLLREPPQDTGVLAKHGLEYKKYFLFVGRLVPEKGVHHLIEAYRKLKSDYPLVIIGDDVNATPYRNELFAQQSANVRFLGFLYGQEYEQLLSAASVYVSASCLEGTSPSLLAAMGAQVCCLVNGIEENAATSQGAAILFAKNQYDDLRNRWQQLVDQPELIAEWGQKAYRHVVAHYRWDSIAEQYLSIFTKVGHIAPKTEAIGDLQ